MQNDKLEITKSALGVGKCNRKYCLWSKFEKNILDENPTQTKNKKIGKRGPQFAKASGLDDEKALYVPKGAVVFIAVKA